MVLSPDHGLFLNGGLVPARLLINGVTITALDVPEVTYFHVELERHAILFAHGVASESYLDTGNRANFENSGAVTTLHPDFARAAHLDACAPLVTDAAVVRPLWERFAGLAGVTAHPLSSDSDPALLLILPDGRKVMPDGAGADGHHVFHFRALRKGGCARLRSRGGIPAKLHPWVDDRRHLGVGVRVITTWTVDGVSADCRRLALDGPSLVDGWWDIERDGARAWRWTDGNAGLELPRGCVALDLMVEGIAGCGVAGVASNSEPRRAIRCS